MLLDHRALELAATLTGSALRQHSFSYRMPQERAPTILGAKVPDDWVDLKVRHFKAAMQLGLPELALEGVEWIPNIRLRSGLQCEALLRMRLAEGRFLEDEKLESCDEATKPLQAEEAQNGGILSRGLRERVAKLKAFRAILAGAHDDALKLLSEAHWGSAAWSLDKEAYFRWEDGEIKYYESLIHASKGTFDSAKAARELARKNNWWKWDVKLPIR